MVQSVKKQHDAKASTTASPQEVQLSTEMIRTDALHTLGENALALMHELRGPLQAIRAHIQLLERKTTGHGSELSHHFLPLYHSIDLVNNLVDQFLHLTHFADTHLVVLDIAECVREMLPLLRSMSVIRLTELQEEIAPALPACMGDAQQLKRLLFNLFANALDSCAEVEKARVCICLKQEDHEIALSVLDNGCGIAADKLETIWLPFFTSKATGTGLGLPACKKIAALHGGSLTVISRLGEGSCFTLRLPIQK